jgi:hypothetical protein
MADGKYFVIKRDKVEHLHHPEYQKDGRTLTGDEVLATLEEYDVPDAHVFREQDIFAGPVLHTYVGAIQTAIEVMELQGVKVPSYFYELRERFAQAADRADSHHIKKLPD